MERVDVEIEPFVEGALAVELEHLATISPSKIPAPHELHEEDDGFVDEEDVIEHVHDHHEHEHHEELVHEEDEATRLKRLQNEERMREIYGPGLDTPCPPPRSAPHRRTSSRAATGSVNGDSLPDLLLAAFKVAMRDRKNVAIVVLSLFILILSLRPNSAIEQLNNAVVMPEPAVKIETTTVFREATVTEMVPVLVTTSIVAPVEVPTHVAKSVQVVQSVESQPPIVEMPEAQPVPAQEDVEQFIEAPVPVHIPEEKVIAPSPDLPSVEVPVQVPAPAEALRQEPVPVDVVTESA
jgi:hypothetical protein